MSPPHEAYAGLVSRLVALAIDIAAVALGAAVTVGLAVGGSQMMIRETPGWVGPVVGVAIGLIPVVYFSASWWIVGQTPGGIAMGIAVRRGGGEPLGLARSLLRTVFGLAFAPIWLLGMALVLVDARRRGLIDLACGTVVVYVPQPSPDNLAVSEP
jgi:uncharacterized RDD family membrane protein YckC